MSEKILTIPTAFGPLKFITTEDVDSMILDEILTLNAYRAMWPHFGIHHPLVLDAGGHKGFWTVAAAAAGAFVHAYEPNPESFLILERNVELNGLQDRVIALNCGIWSETGPRRFSVPRDSSGCASTVHQGHDKYFVAMCLSFNEVCAGKNFMFMKMDVEGAEVEIVESASDAALRSIQRFGMELHGRFLQTDMPEKLSLIFNLSNLNDVRGMAYLYGDRR